MIRLIMPVKRSLPEFTFKTTKADKTNSNMSEFVYEIKFNHKTIGYITEISKNTFIISLYIKRKKEFMFETMGIRPDTIHKAKQWLQKNREILHRNYILTPIEQCEE